MKAMITNSKRTLPSLSILCLALTLTACGGDDHKPIVINLPQPTTLSEQLDSYLEINQPDNTAGVSVLVRHNGQVTYQSSKGLANTLTGLSINNNTGFRMASITKSFTALAIMQLVEQGLLSVEDKLVDYLPELTGENLADITIHQLLTHQSGIPDYVNDNDNVRALDDITTTAMIAANEGFDDLEFEPVTEGLYGQYSNTGYVLLAVIIERLSGQSFPDYMQTQFYDAIGMTDSYVISEQRGIGEQGEEVALNYANTANVMGFNSLIYGSSGQVSSTTDIGLFFDALENEQIVSGETLELMTGKKSEIEDVGHYGYGWLRGSGDYWYNTFAATNDIFHTGGFDGYRTLLLASPDHDFQVVMLSNGGDATWQHVIKMTNMVRAHYAQ